ncbi:hypothetical protein GCM10027343_12340 [Noviherbaspirillum agri]
MRFILPALFMGFMLIPPFASAANDNDFSGAWVAWLCPEGVKRDSGQCSNFVLELHQQQDKLCGAHLYATAGAARVDEGMAPSVTGDVANGIANVVVISGRSSPPVRVRVEIRKTDGMLQWQRLESPRGDYLMPLSARMTKSRSRTLFAPVFEHELKAACLSAFTMAGQPPAQPVKP